MDFLKIILSFINKIVCKRNNLNIEIEFSEVSNTDIFNDARRLSTKIHIS